MAPPAPGAAPRAPAPNLPVFQRRNFLNDLRWLSGVQLAFELGFQIGMWAFKPSTIPVPQNGFPYFTIPRGSDWAYYSYGVYRTNRTLIGISYNQGWPTTVPPSNTWPQRNDRTNQVIANAPGNMPTAVSTTFGLWMDSISNLGVRRGDHVASFVRPAPGVVDPAYLPVYYLPGTNMPFGGVSQLLSPSLIGAPMTNWVTGFAPSLTPILPQPWATPMPQPVFRPWHRPAPISPQWPAVGPTPLPRPQPWVQPQPLSPVVPTPIPIPPGVILPRTVTLPRPGTHPTTLPNVVVKQVPSTLPVRNPPPGTRQRKVAFNAWMSFLWNAVSPLTEAIDFVENLYEALPKALKIAAYKSLGRQPTIQEKSALIFKHIDKVDVPKAMIGYVRQQVTDAIYALGGTQLAKANRKNNRPIGYSAGGGLNGGPMVSIGRL